MGWGREQTGWQDEQDAFGAVDRMTGWTGWVGAVDGMTGWVERQAGWLQQLPTPNTIPYILSSCPLPTATHVSQTRHASANARQPPQIQAIPAPSCKSCHPVRSPLPRTCPRHATPVRMRVNRPRSNPSQHHPVNPVILSAPTHPPSSRPPPDPVPRLMAGPGSGTLHPCSVPARNTPSTTSNS